MTYCKKCCVNLFKRAQSHSTILSSALNFIRSRLCFTLNEALSIVQSLPMLLYIEIHSITPKIDRPIASRGIDRNCAPNATGETNSTALQVRTYLLQVSRRWIWAERAKEIEPIYSPNLLGDVFSSEINTRDFA